MRESRPQRATSGADGALKFPVLVSGIALGLAMALVIARATFLESIRDTVAPSAGATALPRTAGATTGIVFDLLMCTPALLVLLRRAIDPAFRLRSRLSHVLFGGFAMLALASGWWASDKFLAVISSFHLIAAAAIMWAMTQLVRSWLHVRLSAAVSFGLLLIFLGAAAIRLSEIPQDIKYWEANKTEELRRRGWAPDSFLARQFETKLTGGELYGFTTSPNSFAAIIILVSIITAGAAVQRIADRDEFGWPATMIIALLAVPVVIYYTHSRTAFASPFLAAGLLIATPFMARRPRRSYWIGVAVLLLGAVMLIGHGLYHGSLVIDSLTFRWRYWIGSMRVFLDHPIVGVGWSNFGDWYVSKRLPIASEEIKDPHNLVIRALVELGVIGGGLMIAWLSRIWWELTSPATPPPPSTHELSRRVPALSPARIIAAMCIGAIVLNVLGSVDFYNDSPDSNSYILLQIYNRVLFLLLLLLGVTVAIIGSAKHPHLDDRPAPWTLRAIIVALAIFLIHNLIDFSLFEPGPMMLFAMLAGAGLGARSCAAEPDGDVTASPNALRRSRLPAWAALAGASVMVAAAGIVIVAPVAVAESLAAAGDQQFRAGAIGAAASDYSDAFRSLWIPNADYAYRASVAMQSAGESPQRVGSMLDAAIAADPISPKFFHARAQVELSQSQPDAAGAISDLRRVTELDPADVNGHLELANALSRFGHRAAAAEEYRQALQFNNALDPDDPKRLSPAQVKEVEAHAGAAALP